MRLGVATAVVALLVLHMILLFHVRAAIISSIASVRVVAARRVRALIVCLRRRRAACCGCSCGGRRCCRYGWCA